MSTGPTGSNAAQAATKRLETELVEPLLALGLDLEAVEITPAGKRRVLRVAVDQDGGVSMDDVAAATRAVGDLLDDSDLMGQQPYTLELTSRGVDRPLVLSRHWRRNADRLVKVTLADGTEVTGRIGDSDDEGVTLDVDDEPRRLVYADIERALVQIEFNRKKSRGGDETDADDDPDDPDDPDDADDVDVHDAEDDDEDDA